MANTVVVVCKHFVSVSIELHYGFALVLVPLKDPADLDRDQDSKLLLDQSGPTPCRKRTWELTWPLCSPSTTMIRSDSCLGTMVSSISCLTSDKHKENIELCQNAFFSYTYTARDKRDESTKRCFMCCCCCCCREMLCVLKGSFSSNQSDVAAYGRSFNLRLLQQDGGWAGRVSLLTVDQSPLLRLTHAGRWSEDVLNAHLQQRRWCRK